MVNNKNILSIFIPAVLIMALFAFIRFKQMDPSRAQNENTDQKELSLVPILANDPIIGEKKSPNTVIIFEDLACEACRTQSEILKELISKHPGKIKVIVKLLNVNTLPFDTTEAHAYAYCANEQGKFLSFMDGAFANQTNLSPSLLQIIKTNSQIDEEKFSKCYNSEASATHSKKNEYIARTLNIQSVPAVFLNQKQIKTPNSVAVWESLLQL